MLKIKGVGKYVVTLGLMFLFTVFTASSLFAGLKVDPSVIEVPVDSGGEEIQVVRITNTGDAPLDVNIRYYSSEKGGDMFIHILGPEDLALNAGEEKEVLCRIMGLKDVEGELKGRIKFIAAKAGNKQNSFGLIMSIPVYAIIQGTVKLGADIKDIKVEYGKEDKILKGSILVENAGNVHIRPYIDCAVFKYISGEETDFSVPYGQVVQKGKIKQLFIKEKNIELSPGKYSIKVNLDYGKMYGQKGMVVTKEAEFEVKPAEGKADQITADAGL